MVRVLLEVEDQNKSLNKQKLGRNLYLVIIDSHLDLVQHVSSVCRTCYLYIHNISKIRCYLNENAAAKIVNALVTSRLDYANAILYGIPDDLLHHLQLVQNSAAHLVLRRRRHDHVMLLLEKLHWLPISLRIKFKINLHTYGYDAPVHETYLIRRLQQSTATSIIITHHHSAF